MIDDCYFSVFIILFYEYNLNIEKEEIDQIKLLLLQYKKLIINNDTQLNTYHPINNLRTNILNFPILFPPGAVLRDEGVTTKFLGWYACSISSSLSFS